VTLVLTLKAQPPQRLDLSPLVPNLLKDKSAKEIAAIDLATTKEPAKVGDIFGIRAGSADEIRFEGGSERFDNVGAAATSGRVVLTGDAGSNLGRKLAGGEVIVKGHVGPYAGSGIESGRLEIIGDAGDFLGAPREGEIHGMSGGLLIVRGTVGDRAGDRLRRGTIIIEGDAGDWLGSRLVAGTLIVLGAVGLNPGYLMRRGTLALANPPDLPPYFVDDGSYFAAFASVIGRTLKPESAGTDRFFRGPLHRFAGDMSVLGKGEIFVPG
jgi:formylmethanofuran dehydrogenase subunit C